MTSTNFVRSYVLTGLAILGFATQANAATYVEIFTEAQAADGLPSPFLDTVVVSGGVAYAVNRDLTAADTGSVVAYDGSSFTTIMTPAQWAATGSTFDIAAFYGANVVGGNLRAISFFDNNMFDVDLVTGTVTEVVSALDFGLAAGGAVNIASTNLVNPDGSAFAYDGTSDAIYQVSSGGAVSTLATEAQLLALGTNADRLQGGMALVGDELYFGTIGDEMYKWDISSGTGSLVFTEAQLEALSDDIDGSVGFGDIYYGPDGQVYFYESDADYIYKFNPSDPVGSLSVVLTEAELLAGPSNDTAFQFTWWDGNLAWTSSVGFNALPEPTSAMLAFAGAACLAAGRRR